MCETQLKLPLSLLELDPKRKIALERSDFASNIGRAVINLANISNGIYLIKYLRFKEPVSLSSKIKYLGTSATFYLSKSAFPNSKS